MRNELLSHAKLADPELLLEVRRLAMSERAATAQLIAVLGELDARRLYLAEGCASLFAYCTQKLHLSEHAAYGRIEAARAARKWPIVLELIADGSLHLTAVALLSRHLTDENHRELFALAGHKTKREVEEIVAALRPQPCVPSTVRKLSAPKPAPIQPDALDVPPHREPLVATSAGCDGPPRLPPMPARPQVEIKPLAPEQYKVQFTASRETYRKLSEAQDLLRHRIPNGDVALIFDRALTLLLKELHRTRHAAVDRPRGEQSPPGKHGRHVPAAVKRVVWNRDGGQCAFVGATVRCSERIPRVSPRRAIRGRRCDER